jgi:hypothetical protein
MAKRFFIAGWERERAERAKREREKGSERKGVREVEERAFK